MPLTVLLLSADPDLEPLYRDLLTGAGYRIETDVLFTATRDAEGTDSIDPNLPSNSPKLPVDAVTANNVNDEATDVAVLFTSPATAPRAATALRRKGINTVLVAAPAEDPDAPNPNPTDPVAIAHVHDQLWQAGIAELLVAPTPLDLLRAIEDAAATDASELVTRHRNLGVVSAGATTEGDVSRAPAAPEDEDEDDHDL